MGQPDSGGGGGTDAGPLSIACNQPAEKQCYVAKLSGNGVSDSSMLASDCTTSASDATVVSSCPTSGLVGCCTLEAGTITGILTEICYYMGTASMQESACTGDRNDWSTTE